MTAHRPFHNAKRCEQGKSESLHALLNALNNPLVVFRRSQGQIIDANPAAAELYGYSRTEMLRLCMRDLSLHLSVEAILGLPSNPLPYQQLHRRRNGDSFPARTEILSIADNEDAWMIAAVYEQNASDDQMNDVDMLNSPSPTEGSNARTESKGSAPLLNRSSQRIIQAALDGYVCLDLRGRFLDVNDSYAQMTGFSRSELLHMSISDVEATETPSQTIAHIAHVLEKGSQRFQTSQRTKTGEIIFLEVSATRDAHSLHRLHGFLRDVTPQKNAEDALRRSEEKFAKAFILSPDIVSLSTLDGGKYLDVNSAFESHSGYTREELLGRSAFDLGLWPKREARQEMIAQLVAGKEIRNWEVPFKRKDGTVRTGQLSAELIHIGEKPYVLAVIRDVTDLISSDRMIKFQAQVLNAISQAVVVTDLQGLVLFWNRASEAMFGWTEQEILGQNVHDLAGPGSQDPRVIKALGATISEGTWEGDVLAYRRDGAAFPVSVSSALVDVGISGSVSIVSIVTDISERKRSEAALRESEQLHRELFEKTADPIGVAAIDGRILDVNPAACVVFDRTQEALLSLRLQDLAQSRWKEIQASMQVVFEKGQGLFEWSTQDSRKEPRFFELHVRHLQYKGQQAVLGIARDITQRRQMEELLRASLEEKSVLLQEMHHRVKNNLQIVASLLNLGKSQITDPAAIGLISESCRRIELMASVYELVYQSEDLTSIDFAQFLRRSATDLLEASSDNRPRITFTSTLAPLRLSLQPTIYLGIVVHELISNAVKHAFLGRETGHIELNVSIDDTGAFTIRVFDNGIGIRPSVNIEGSHSLGMRLVEILVRQLGGQILIQADKGTTCMIIFPSVPK
jgi:PAS domain S-box-containing protein